MARVGLLEVNASCPNSVIQVTTRHPWHDNRIYVKTVRSLVRLGFDVSYLAPGPNNVVDTDVTFVWLSSGKGLRTRILRLWQALVYCYKSQARLVHFHDPEFIPVGLLLHLFGKKVIYDIHEDNKLGFLQRDRHLLVNRFWSVLISVIEWGATKAIYPVLAEKAYLQRFPAGTLVLNYPVITSSEPASRPATTRFIYTGNVSKDRGALLMTDLLKDISDSELYVIGKCSDELKNELMERAGGAKPRLHLITSEDSIPFDKIVKWYKQSWTAGLAMFPDTPHYRDKELTKLFEYMQYGIPILCSDFPTWKALVEANQVGFCVDPGDVKEIRNKVRKLTSNNEVWKMYSINGPKTVNKKYSWQSQMVNLVQVYKKFNVYAAQTDRIDGEI